MYSVIIKLVYKIDRKSTWIAVCHELAGGCHCGREREKEAAHRGGSWVRDVEHDEVDDLAGEEAGLQAAQVVLLLTRLQLVLRLTAPQRHLNTTHSLTLALSCSSVISCLFLVQVLFQF